MTSTELPRMFCNDESCKLCRDRLAQVKNSTMRYSPYLVLFLIVYLLSAEIAVAETDADRVRRSLSERFPSAHVEQVVSSPVADVFEVIIEGAVVYVSGDGRYVFNGALLELGTGENLTERVLAKRRREALAQMPEDRMIIFEPEGEVKYTLTTFTDIDCAYCRRMHQEMAQLNGNGIRVRYLLYPRAGENSVSYEKAVSVWCSEDRQEELTFAKAGNHPKQRGCNNPVKEHMELATSLGLTGTPMSITETGERINGYVPAKTLLKQLAAGSKGEE